MAAISDTMAKAISEQIHLELTASYAYLAKCAYFEEHDLPGFASWMRKQSEEEREHAMKLFDYLHDRDGNVAWQGLDTPQAGFKSVRAAVEGVLAHEERVSTAIHRLYEQAIEAKDHATSQMLLWFVEEQVEEEKMVRDVLGRLDLIEEHGGSLLLVDREVGAKAQGG